MHNDSSNAKHNRAKRRKTSNFSPARAYSVIERKRIYLCLLSLAEGSKCPLCSTEFYPKIPNRKKTSAVKHISRHDDSVFHHLSKGHPERMLYSDRTGKFYCAFAECSFSCYLPVEYAAHCSMAHHPEKTIFCSGGDGCTAVFDSRAAYDFHYNRHHPEPPATQS